MSSSRWALEPDDARAVAFGMMLDVEANRLVLRLSGDADATVADALDQFMREAIVRDVDRRDVEVVLGEVTYFDVRVVGVLLGIAHELRIEGRSMAFVAPSAAASRMLGLLGLDRILDIREQQVS